MAFGLQRAIDKLKSFKLYLFMVATIQHYSSKRMPPILSMNFLLYKIKYLARELELPIRASHS